MVTLRKARAAWLTELEKAGAHAPAFELGELLQMATGLSPAKQRVCENEPLNAEHTVAVTELVRRRCGGEPLQYILGEWEFYGLPFYVGEGVLIPRADTETLVDAALALCANMPSARIADLCSGSGCIAVALAKRLPNAQVTAVELSDTAFAYLTKNIVRNGAHNVTALHGDVLAEHEALAGLDLIVSNPPYIATAELAGLAPEVQREPRMALDGTADGLYFYRELAHLCKARLRVGGWLAFECGDEQADAVCTILHANGYECIALRRDLEGFARVVYAQWGCPSGKLT